MAKIKGRFIRVDNSTIENFSDDLRQVPGTDGGFVVGPGVEQRLVKLVDIDGLVTGQENLYTATGNNYVITKAIVRVSAISGFSVEGAVSIGISGPGYSEIYPETILAGLDGTGKMFTFTSLLGAQALLLDGQTVVFDIDTAYISTSVTLEVDLFGYII